MQVKPRWTLTVFVDCGIEAGHGRLQRSKTVAGEISAIEDIDVRYLLSSNCTAASTFDNGVVVVIQAPPSWQTIARECRPGDGPLLIDSCCLSETDFSHLRDLGFCFIQVEEGRRFDQYTASLVIDSSATAPSAPYSGQSDTVFLLGPGYFPLRRDIRNATPYTEQPEEATRLLLSFGGSDPGDAAALVLDVVKDDPYWSQITVILGPSYQGKLDPGRVDSDRISILQYPKDYVQYVMSSNLVVCGAGMSAWEFAWLGLPMALLVMRDDQLLSASTLEDSKAAVVLGHLNEFDPEWTRQALAEIRSDKRLREMLALNCRSLLDGDGASRIAQEVAHLWHRWNNG